MPRAIEAAAGREGRAARSDPDDAGSRGTALRPAVSPTAVLTSLIERFPHGLVVFDSALDVVSANEAAHRVLHPLGVQVGQALPEPWPEFSLNDYARAVLELPVAQRLEVRPDDEHTFTITGVAAKDRFTGMLILEDVSVSSRRARLEREFIANAAHELLTPLTGIAGAAHVLESGAKEVPEDRDRFLHHIAQECDRLTRLARALLIVARAQSGEQPPRLELLDLAALLQRSRATVPDSVPISVHCPEGMSVLADPDVAEQAFTHLLQNAVRHAREGSISITAAESGGGMVSIDFADGGPGILPEHLGRAPQRFFSGGGRDSGGFGLGVSIAAQALETLGGRLLIESTPGHGTHARAELPVGFAVPA